MTELRRTERSGAGLAPRLQLFPVLGIPSVWPGDDVAALILDALKATGEALADGDVVVVAQKIVSKAEGRFVALETVTPSPAARELAARTGKDPRVVELILRESVEVLRSRPGLIIAAHRLGLVLANAGIDESNVGRGAENAVVLLLPEDPDGSCRRLRAALGDGSDADVAVIVNDSLGRAWRQGTVGTALGVAGTAALADLCGQPDLYGRPLRTTTVGWADEIAAAASLVQGQADEGLPVVVVRGLARARTDGRGADLVRPRELDLFR